MEKVKINLGTTIDTNAELSGFTLIESGNSLILTFNDIRDTVDFSVGDIIQIKRFLYKENGVPEVIEADLSILEIDYEAGKIILPAIEPYSLYIDARYPSNIDSGSSILEFETNHDIFFQDRSQQNNPITLYDIDGNIKSVLNDGYCLTTVSHLPISSDEFLTSYYDIEACDDDERVYTYTYLPNTVSRKRYFLSGVTSESIADVRFASFKYNPFYFKDDNGVCTLWKDEFFNDLSDDGLENVSYKRDIESRVGLFKKCDYWGVNLGLGSDSNETDLGYEDLYNGSMLDDIVEDLIPGFIDMERVKYQPVVKDASGKTQMATGITLYFHFRKRKKITDNKERYTQTTPATSGNIYYDSWVIDEDSDDTWWNGYGECDLEDSGGLTQNEEDGNVFDLCRFKTFVNNRGRLSDLLGYLNFTDKDVFYRKQKVSKTFVRLLFYTSDDPVEQKLLYYSTVFLDGGELFGKYIKQLTAMIAREAADERPSFVSDTGGGEEVNQNAKVVMEDNTGIRGVDENRVDSKIVITNEYDRTKSSEGFNIYLFADDQKALEENLENGTKTIYMKVEFNHAGNGKTIPMIMWPKVEIEGKEGEYEYTALTIENFLKSLYIPIEIKYLNEEDKYVYTMPEELTYDGGIHLVLFEPKLTDLPDPNLDEEQLQ